MKAGGCVQLGKDRPEDEKGGRGRNEQVLAGEKPRQGCQKPREAR